MTALRWLPGSSLSPSAQREVLAAYVHRYTGEHKPAWAHDNSSARPQYATDMEWLQHNYFAVTKDYRLDKRIKHCRSYDGSDTRS